VIRADGTGKKPVTHNARNPNGKTSSCGPMWSPDGRLLAYRELTAPEPRRQQSRIKIVDASDPETVLRDVEGQGLDWSPDGREFLFSKGRSPADLHVVELETGAIRNLTEGLSGEKRFGPTTYTSDGRIVTFAHLADMAEQWQIFIMDSDGKNLRALTDSRTSGPAADLNPHFGGTLLIQHKKGGAWPESGSRLPRFMHRRQYVVGPPGGPDRGFTWQFAGHRDGKDIYSFERRIPARGENPQIHQKEVAYEGKRLVVFQDEVQRVSIIPAGTGGWNGFAENSIQTLSADGAHAVFALRHVNGHTLCRANLQNGGYETIGLRNKDEFRGVKVSPDGKRIVFMRVLQAAGRGEICVIGIDGAGLRVIEENGVDPAWGPDSRRIVYVRAPQAVCENRVRSGNAKDMMADLATDMAVADLATGEKPVLTRVTFHWFGLGIAWSGGHPPPHDPNTPKTN